MRSSHLAAGLASCVAVAFAANHHLFVGSFKTNHLFSLTYDDDSNSFITERSIQAHGGHQYLDFNFDRSVLYGAERDGWSSYSVQGPGVVEHTANLQLRSRCDGDDFKHGQTTMFVSQKFPYMIYGSGRSPCGAVLGVRTDGSLDMVVQNISFRTTSRVKGMASDAEGKYLFSADQKGNGIWVHKIDQKTGKLDRGTMTELPIDNSRPARVVVHPAGRYLYVLLSKQNAVGVFEIVPRSGNLSPQLRFTNVTVSLVPSTIDGSLYRGQDLLLSKDGNVLYGTVRYRRRKKKDRTEEAEVEEEEEEEGEDWGEEDEEEYQNPWSGIFGNGRGSSTSSSSSSSPTGWGDNSRGGGGGENWGGWGSVPSNNGGRSSSGGGGSPYRKRSVIPDYITVMQKDQLDEVHYANPKITRRQWGNFPPQPQQQQQQQPPAQQEQSLPGILTAVLLSAPENAPKTGVAANGLARGWPLSLIMQASTATSGGRSNAIAPAPWNNDFFALTDSEIGMVQVWRLDGLATLPRDGPKTMISQGSASGINAASPYGKATGQRASVAPPPQANIRANIVAEWRAPPDAVGDPSVKNKKDRNRDRDNKLQKRDGTRTSSGSVSRRQQAEPIPSGRGCCANGVWYD